MATAAHGLLVTAVLTATLLPAFATEHSREGIKVDLLQAQQPGGRRTLLSAEHRSSFLGQSYHEAVLAKLNEKRRRAFGRKLLQTTDPIAQCGLQFVVAAAAGAGVSIPQIVDLFLAVLLEAEVAATPSGFGTIVSSLLGGPNSATCQLVRLRLQALAQITIAQNAG